MDYLVLNPGVFTCQTYRQSQSLWSSPRPPLSAQQLVRGPAYPYRRVGSQTPHSALRPLCGSNRISSWVVKRVVGRASQRLVAIDMSPVRRRPIGRTSRAWSGVANLIRAGAERRPDTIPQAADAVYKGLLVGTLMGTTHRLDSSPANYNESLSSFTLPTNYTNMSPCNCNTSSCALNPDFDPNPVSRYNLGRRAQCMRLLWRFGNRQGEDSM
ncbi:hypothetical protein C7974DRAFT_51939 [Boeremia exigua]|uniref:uncharacterized protein n=1 Tax=Boeremia exigua TaxID=749465 RepID=UPI001E8E3356|nr:uncharacterized protein C7974DRAFT_51939 [Boeremia exigua]KAH6616764.1 hypothetical protein C7974DRAFT_51939 [Boeremia exigua]